MKEIVLVEWEDSTQPRSAWQFISEFVPSKPIRCLSVGFVLSNKKKVLALASNMGNIGTGSEQANGIIHIPHSAIRSIRKIKVKA